MGPKAAHQEIKQWTAHFTTFVRSHLTHSANRPSAPQVSSTLIPLPADAVDAVNPQQPLTLTQVRDDDVPIVLVEGGIAGTCRSPVREGVSDFVRAHGAQAGINGTFFANASLRGTDNLLIGPSLCNGETQATIGPYDQKSQLTGRPLVLMSANRTLILPYDPRTLDTDNSLHAMMPGLTDAFLGGVWLVHDANAVRRDDLAKFQVKDADDPRRRAFFGLTADGRPVLGATTDSVSSSHLARALQQAGLREAVLLDSGFSTSLVYKDQILVTGHSSLGVPSRPVPHALVLFGQTALTQMTPLPSHISRHHSLRG